MAQVTTAIVVALQASGPRVGVSEEPMSKNIDDTESYSIFQLAKPIGFCCVHSDNDILPIWEYFNTTDDVDTHCTKLLE